MTLGSSRVKLARVFRWIYSSKKEMVRTISFKLSPCYSVLAISTLSVLVVFDVYHCWSNDIAS